VLGLVRAGVLVGPHHVPNCVWAQGESSHALGSGLGIEAEGLTGLSRSLIGPVCAFRLAPQTAPPRWLRSDHHGRVASVVLEGHRAGEFGERWSALLLVQTIVAKISPSA
jgi:hypothetical protein